MGGENQIKIEILKNGIVIPVIAKNRDGKALGLLTLREFTNIFFTSKSFNIWISIP